MTGKSNNVLMAEMAKDIEYIKKYVERLDKKFAAKWVEQGAKVLVVTVFLALIGALLKLILV